MHQANLTRFGPLHKLRTTQDPGTHHFNAVAGPGILVVNSPDHAHVQVWLNEQPVIGPDTGPDIAVTPSTIKDEHKFEVPVTLQSKNALRVNFSDGSPDTANIRITQMTEADLGLERQGYFGLNTTDIERQREYYKTLGFIGEIYPAGPETSTSFARSLGFEDDYLIYVSLHSLQDPPEPPFVDTVQFRGASFRSEPPYAALNHLGMTYATYGTTDLDGDYAFLINQGISFLAAPTIGPDGERFTFMQEPDGAFIKLMQEPGEVSDTRPNLTRLVNTNMNVSDLERSIEFYRLLGFTRAKSTSQSGAGDFAAAHGFSQNIAFEGADISLGEGTDGATLQLRQWTEPYDDAPPYPPPVNHLGIDRINFYVKDLTATINTMNDLGFKQLGPVGGWPEFGIVFFFDPDGIKVQFAGPIPAA